jgi:hypothetical protein
MNVRQIVWIGVSSLAVASWFSAASTPDVRTPAAPVEHARPAQDLDRSSAVMQTEVARLRDRLSPSAAPTHARDLFRFAGRVQRPQPELAPEPVVAIEAPAPERPALQLIGVAEDESADGTVRTAIVSGHGDVFLVKAGDLVAGQYRVEQVTADAVQLTDTTTSVPTTLALR